MSMSCLEHKVINVLESFVVAGNCSKGSKRKKLVDDDINEVWPH